MKLKNISARPHWIGDTLIVPGDTVEVDAVWRGAVNANELIEVVEEVESPEAPKRGRKPKTEDQE